MLQRRVGGRFVVVARGVVADVVQPLLEVVVEADFLRTNRCTSGAIRDEDRVYYYASAPNMDELRQLIYDGH